jgi:hypothetical protein
MDQTLRAGAWRKDEQGDRSGRQQNAAHVQAAAQGWNAQWELSLTSGRCDP